MSKLTRNSWNNPAVDRQQTLSSSGGKKQEEVRGGGRRTGVQLDRQRTGELKIREGREIDVTKCV